MDKLKRFLQEEGGQDPVEGSIGEGPRPAGIGSDQGGLRCSGFSGCLPEHGQRAIASCGEAGPCGQRLEVEAGAAPHVQHRLPGAHGHEAGHQRSLQDQRDVGPGVAVVAPGPLAIGGIHRVLQPPFAPTAGEAEPSHPIGRGFPQTAEPPAPLHRDPLPIRGRHRPSKAPRSASTRSARRAVLSRAATASPRTSRQTMQGWTSPVGPMCNA